MRVSHFFSLVRHCRWHRGCRREIHTKACKDQERGWGGGRGRCGEGVQVSRRSLPWGGPLPSSSSSPGVSIHPLQEGCRSLPHPQAHTRARAPLARRRSRVCVRHHVSPSVRCGRPGEMSLWHVGPCAPASECENRPGAVPSEGAGHRDVNSHRVSRPPAGRACAGREGAPEPGCAPHLSRCGP